MLVVQLLLLASFLTDLNIIQDLAFFGRLHFFIIPESANTLLVLAPGTRPAVSDLPKCHAPASEVPDFVESLCLVGSAVFLGSIEFWRRRKSYPVSEVCQVPALHLVLRNSRRKSLSDLVKQLHLTIELNIMDLVLSLSLIEWPKVNWIYAALYYNVQTQY